jgi:hypothetical protein
MIHLDLIDLSVKVDTRPLKIKMAAKVWLVNEKFWSRIDHLIDY